MIPVPVNVTLKPVLHISKTTVAKRTVVQPNTIGYIKAKLESPTEGPYVVQPASNKKALYLIPMARAHMLLWK